MIGSLQERCSWLFRVVPRPLNCSIHYLVQSLGLIYLSQTGSDEGKLTVLSTDSQLVSSASFIVLPSAALFVYWGYRVSLLQPFTQAMHHLLLRRPFLVVRWQALIAMEYRPYIVPHQVTLSGSTKLHGCCHSHFLIFLLFLLFLGFACR